MGGYDSIDVNTTEFVYDNKRAEVGPTLVYRCVCIDLVPNSAVAEWERECSTLTSRYDVTLKY